MSHMNNLPCLLLLSITTCLTGCDTKYPALMHDKKLSSTMLGLPYNSKAIAEIRVYHNKSDKFLSSAEFLKLNPSNVLSDQPKIIDFLEAVKQGRVSSQEGLKNFHYKPDCWHVLYIDSDYKRYAYMKVLISTDSDRPVIAKVQPLWEGNSFVYNRSLPKLLEQ